MPENARIIIAGAGRVGGLVERVLTAAGHHATMIDYSSQRLQVMERFGFKHYFGDATCPELPVIARATDRDHVYDLWAYGCRNIIRETYDSSLRMGRSALEELGLERGTAQDVVDIFDTRDREILIKIADVHKIGVPPSENPDYVVAVRDMREGWVADLQTEVADLIASRGAGTAAD